MRVFDNKETDINLCNKCLKEIPFGTQYYSINRNLEFRCIDTVEMEEEIEVVESEEIITLCKVCGSYFNTQGLDTILKHLPIPGQEIRN